MDGGVLQVNLDPGSMVSDLKVVFESGMSPAACWVPVTGDASVPLRTYDLCSSLDPFSLSAMALHDFGTALCGHLVPATAKFCNECGRKDWYGSRAKIGTVWFGVFPIFIRNAVPAPKASGVEARL